MLRHCFVDDEYKNNRLDDIAIKESPAVLDKYKKVKSALTDAVNIFTHKLKVPGKNPETPMYNPGSVCYIGNCASHRVLGARCNHLA